MHGDPPGARARPADRRRRRGGAARLAAVVVGSRPTERVTMGALASLEQREEVRRVAQGARRGGVARLRRPGARRGGRTPTPSAARSSRRCCSAATTAARAEPHEVEAFGPGRARSSPYGSADEAVELAARGRGSLAGSVVTADADFARRGRRSARPRGTAACSSSTRDRRGVDRPRLAAAGASCTAAPAAPAAARRWAGSAACCTTCSAPPCRPARPCSPRSPAAGCPARPVAATGVHPFRKPLARAAASATRSWPARARSRWRTSSTSPSSPATRSTPTWTRRPPGPTRSSSGRVAHGYLVVSFAAGLFVDPDPGPVLANYGLENLRFLTPVYPGDELTVTLTCKQITPREGGPTTARSAGTPTSPTGRASRSPSTTCSPSWPSTGRRSRPDRGRRAAPPRVRRHRRGGPSHRAARLDARGLPQDPDPPDRPARALRDHRDAARGLVDHPRAVAAAQGDPAGEGAGRGRARDVPLRRGGDPRRRPRRAHRPAHRGPAEVLVDLQLPGPHLRRRRRHRLAGRRRGHLQPGPAVPLVVRALRPSDGPHLQGGVLPPAAGLRAAARR